MPLKYLNRSNNSTAISAGNSVLFNGSSQYLKLPSNSSAWTLSGDFTIECWFNTTTTNQNGIFTMNWNGDWNAYGNGFSLSSNFVVTPQGNTTWTAPSTNVWHHIAVVRSGTTLTTYVDGVSVGSQTNSNQFGNASTTPGVGLFDTQSGIRCPFPGYIGNLRILKGTALYTGASFTVPTAPLTAIANTSLLACQSATIIDNSSNNFTITNNGAATVSSTVPFTASFTPAPSGMKFRNRNNSGTSTPTGNSVLFNGSNQYLSLPNNAALNLGSNNFTMEAFVYISNVSGNKNIFYINGNNSSYSAICLYVQDSQFAFLANQTGGYPWTLQIGAVGPTISSNTWYHVATTRSGNSFYVFVNGTLVSGAPYTLSGALFNGTTNIIGYQPTIASYFNGYISNARIINGTALYTASFTPPTAPLTAIANTSLLTCNAATIVDGSTNNFAITNNNTATVSSTTPFTVASAASTTRVRKVNADAVSSIITSGLVLNLDASNASSYAGSGTSWFDLSGNGNNGTLTNGPTFNSANGGSIVFDGTNDYISIGSQNIVGTGTSAFTGELWWYINKTLASGEYIMPIRIKQDSEFLIALYNSSGTYNLYGVFRLSTQYGIPLTNSDYINKWICMQFVYTGGNKNTASSYKFYINGAQIAVGSNNFGPAGGEGSNCNIIGADGNSGCNTFFTSGVMKGNIASYRLYTGELTAAQLLQNYNATKTKFGL
jgi:hypothetical protein